MIESHLPPPAFWEAGGRGLHFDPNMQRLDRMLRRMDV